MIKITSIIFMFLGACSTHSDLEMRDSNILKQENIAYSKIINYWVDGEYTGKGKNKRWTSGHWEKKLAIPILDSEYIWVSGDWKENKNEE